jgi:serine/threonine protein kinase
LGRRNTSKWDEKIKKQEAAVKQLQAELLRIQEQVSGHPAVREFPELLSALAAPVVSSELISQFFADDFEYLKQLSVTNFSIVQHVRHKESGKELILKEVLHAKDFDREVRHLQALRHPLILPIEKVFTTGGRMIMQLPYLPLGSLRSWFEQQKVPQTRHLPQIQNVMQQVFQAVSYIHSRGVVHRDLKPENILWIRENRIVLCDFGLSRSVAGGGNVTAFFPTGILGNATLAPGALAVTPAYAAPELMSSSEDWKQNPWAVDLWSLGVMLLELVTGQVPADFAETLQHDPSTDLADSGILAMWELAKGLLRTAPSERILANEALFSPFFQPPATTILSLEKRVMEAQGHLLHLRQEARKDSEPYLRLDSIASVSQLTAEQFLSRWNTTLGDNGSVVAACLVSPSALANLRVDGPATPTWLIFLVVLSTSGVLLASSAYCAGGQLSLLKVLRGVVSTLARRWATVPGANFVFLLTSCLFAYSRFILLAVVFTVLSRFCASFPPSRPSSPRRRGSGRGIARASSSKAVGPGSWDISHCGRRRT